MPIVVEDGTGLPDAEAYIDVESADAYFVARGNAAWEFLDTADKEVALRLGADYMGAVYGARWKGGRLTTTQALDWPRTGYDGVPVAVQRANAELAVRSLSGPLLADQGPAVKREKVDVLEVEYADGARQTTFYAAVDAALQSAGLLCGYGQIRVRRA